MKYSLQHVGFMLLATLGMLFICTPVMAAEDDEEILVGRIAHIEGKLLRYIEEYKDWVVTVKDSPFGLDDVLYSGDDTKAEFIMPNKTWLRVGENTQMQLIDLYAEATTVDVASGLARLFNKSDDGVIKVTTPFGYVVAPAGTIFDLYVGDESLEVIAVRGNVNFVHEKTRARYEVWAGSSLIANDTETAQGNGMVDSEWDDWNGEREALWTKRLQDQSTYVDLLPEPLRDQSYILEENGQWERVYYEGAYRDMWRPTRIDPGWRPFTAGRWTVYYGDNCWIPDEPFGYVTHHYGSWVYVESFRNWFWMPPAARFFAGAPGISISFAWFPGRVGWLHSGPSIGWVPLAPDEVYYGYRHWGPRTVIIKNTTVVNINIGHYRYIDEAIIIDRDHFYRGSRYTPNVQRNVNTDVIINTYRPTTVINNTIINNVNIDKRRYTNNDIEVSRKPHATVIERIHDNERRKKEFGHGDRERIEKDLIRVNAKAEPSPKIELHKPRLSTKLVDTNDIAKPFNSLSQEKKVIKPKDRERPISTERVQRLDNKGEGKPGQRGRPIDAKEKGRTLITKDPKQLMEQNAIKAPVQGKESRRLPEDRTPQDEPPKADNKSLKQQLKSPREKQSQGPEIHKQPQDQGQMQEQIPVPRGDKESRRPNRGETVQTHGIITPEDKPRLKSPRESSNKEGKRPNRKDDQPGQQENSQIVNEQKLLPQQQQKKDEQRQQQQEVQQRKQKDEQRQQQEELQQRKQKDEQRQQQEELQQRKQKDEQRQQQEVQQRKQKD
ncbi:MAG: FecR family protein, partial [Proteobacteria bacterium]|nr:FecR family protein [Pseudomonadota bacterium]